MMAHGGDEKSPRHGGGRHGYGYGMGGHPAPEKDESQVRWLISYSDFMMQLLCLFILLYSISATDAGKVSPIAQSWREQVGLEPIHAMSESMRESSLPLTMEKLPAVLKDMQVVLSRYPEGGKIRITPTSDGFKLHLFYEMFEEGSGTPSRQGLRILDLAALILKPFERRVKSLEVVGHTAADDADREGGSALRLSLARAREAYRYLTSMDCLHPLEGGLLIAGGRGPYEPAANNLEARSRGFNRRVEFVAHLEQNPEKLKARAAAGGKK
jgi:flagellar motor protein MotB